MASPRSAPPHAQLRAGPLTPKFHTRTFSSEPSSIRSRTQFDIDSSCSAIPAAPWDDIDQLFTCSDPSERSLFGVSRRVSCTKVLPRADSAFAVGSEPPNKSLRSTSTKQILTYEGTLTRQRPKIWKFPSPHLQHPSMEQVGQVGAELILRDRPVGAFVFRPGSREHMFLSWKTGDQAYEHSKIIFDFSRSRQAPPKLRLQCEVYENLNEIESQYITPLVKYVRALYNHPSFCAAKSIQEVFKTVYERQELHSVFEEQQLYVIAPFYRRPGTYCHSFIVVFIRDDEPVKVRFQVTPRGYFVLGRRCTTPNMIIHCLMENFKVFV